MNRNKTWRKLTSEKWSMACYKKFFMLLNLLFMLLLPRLNFELKTMFYVDLCLKVMLKNKKVILRVQIYVNKKFKKLHLTNYFIYYDFLLFYEWIINYVICSANNLNLPFFHISKTYIYFTKKNRGIYRIHEDYKICVSGLQGHCYRLLSSKQLGSNTSTYISNVMDLGDLVHQYFLMFQLF